jgi:hypothetical protein
MNRKLEAKIQKKFGAALLNTWTKSTKKGRDYNREGDAYDFMRFVIQLGGHGGKRQINHPAANGWGIEKTAIKN